MHQWQHIDQTISEALGEDFITSNQRSVGGGCINEAYVISNGSYEFFVKLNAANMEPMFAAEATGLSEIIDSNSVRAPKPICWGRSGSQSYIVMESLKLGGNNSEASSKLGHQLALMHKKTSDKFGWKMDNTIGSTPQPNTYNKNWLEFLAKTRLGFQLDLAKKNGCSQSLVNKGARLLENLNVFFTDYSPEPSLLHGDLWSGNYAIMTTGQPVIFDPAIYYGDREADLAMTELFGNFGQGFYDSYNETWPLDPGYAVRKTLYNLYHIINHFNLFGGGYGNQAENMTEKLLSEIA